jgi:hypothetical protein
MQMIDKKLCLCYGVGNGMVHKVQWFYYRRLV